MTFLSSSYHSIVIPALALRDGSRFHAGLVLHGHGFGIDGLLAADALQRRAKKRA